jgi:hypothetical protein
MLLKIGGLLALLTPVITSANAIYWYEGNNFNDVGGVYDASMKVTGSFKTASPLPPAPTLTDYSASISGYSFFDGVALLTDANSAIDSFDLLIDPLGQIEQWKIVVSTLSFATAVGDTVLIIETTSQSSPSRVLDGGANGTCTQWDTVSKCFEYGGGTGYGQIEDSSGSWSRAVPSPATVLLVAFGLTGLGFERHRKLKAS